MFLMVTHLYSDVRLPKIFASNMVLQQNSDVRIWGWADPNESVTVSGSWSAESVMTIADNSGQWLIKLRTPIASLGGVSYRVTVSGKNQVVLDGVLVGEVWLLSGQSNMALLLGGALFIEGGEEAINGANYPELRLITIGRKSASTPQEDLSSSSGWLPCSPETVRNFSAIGYFFGRELIQKMRIPIGLICNAIGSSSCEAWTRAEDLAEVTDFNGKGPWESQRQDDWTTPTVLYNGMVAPLVNFTIAGVCWYQGEGNIKRAGQIVELLPAMIAGWRDAWCRSDLPFYYVQLPPFGGWSSADLTEFWEAQLSVSSLPKTGMIVTLDVGDINNIHPPKKEPVGRRLALWAEAQIYGYSNLVYSGPFYKAMQIENGKILLSFDHAETGLTSFSDSLDQFEISGSDEIFHPASAIIQSDKIIVWNVDVPNPEHVRYAWKNTAVACLYNNVGLPAAPFNTKKRNLLGKVKITSIPRGMRVTIDGSTYTTPCYLSFQSGSVHSIGILDTIQSNAPNIRNVFNCWSDGGKRNHFIVSDHTSIYMVSFNTQYYLNKNSRPLEGGDVLIKPVMQLFRDGWYEKGTQVMFGAFARTEHGYLFGDWGGDLQGSLNPIYLIMNSPKNIIGNFRKLNSLLITGLSELPERSNSDYSCFAIYDDGINYDISNLASWSVNSNYATIDTTGRVTTLSVNSDQVCTIMASYAGKSITKTITIKAVEKTLNNISLSGPSEINENSYSDYICTANYDDGTYQDVSKLTSWSTNSNNASIDQNGRLTTLSVSSDQICTIIASYGSKSIVKSITIQDIGKTLINISISGPSEINENSYADYICTANFNDGTYQILTDSVSWSENSVFAIIDNKGRLTTLSVISEQFCTIMVSYNGQYNTKSIRIKDIVKSLVDISISGPSELNENSDADYICLANYDDGTHQDITNLVAWSENSNIISIDSRGHLMASSVLFDQYCSLEARYSGMTCVISVLIKDRTPATGSKLSNETVYAYPNPFNPSLVSSCFIRFSLSRSGSITIDIYDVSNRLVKNV
jgi:sialate O-acetylesterase